LRRQHHRLVTHAQFVQRDLLEGSEDSLPEFDLAETQLEASIGQQRDPSRKPRVAGQAE
jgi:hypothetical protein